MKTLVTFLMLISFSLNLFCQFHWKRHPDNPVMTGTPGTWDENYVMPVTVLYYNDTYHMYYIGSSDDIEGFGYATSPDGITWTRDPNNPVMVPGDEGEWDSNGISDCYVVKLDTIFHMWYTGNASSDLYRIGHATSPDGLTWTKDPDNPIEEFIEGDPANTYTACSPVVYDGTNFHLYYSTGIWHGSKMAINHAMSEDGYSWTLDPNNPIMLASDNDEYRMPEFILYNGNHYLMSFLIGYLPYFVFNIAISADLYSWEIYEHNPVFTKGPLGSWDGKIIARATILFDSTENNYKMWYAGDANPPPQPISSKIGYAESYEPAWMQMASMRKAKGGAASCVLDSLIYVCGGLVNSAPVASMNEAEVYNTKTDTWSDLAPVPINLYSVSAGVINDTVYLAGGWSNEGTSWFTIDSTFAFDPETDSWETKKECAKKAAGHASCVLDDKLFLFGGVTGQTDTDTLGQKQALVYDPATDTWDALPDMLYAHNFESRACVYDGQIYVLGGIDSEWNTIEKVERYDPGENTWTPLADMPVPVLNHVCLVYNDKIYVFGGDSLWNTSADKAYSTDIIQEYYPLTDQWQIMESMPFNRSNMTGKRVGNNAYLIGGYPEDSRDFPSVLDEVWRFNLDSLRVWEPLCSGVNLSVSEMNLDIEGTALLSPNVLPYYLPDRSVSWESSNEAVASVSSGGMVTAVSNGEATITATATSGGCWATCIVYVGPAGIQNHFANRIVLYPNPLFDKLTIETEQSNNQLIEIRSLNGQLLYSNEIAGSECQIDLSSFRKGVYFITIRSKDYVTTRKIIKM